MTRPKASRTLILPLLLLIAGVCTAQPVWEATGGPLGGSISALTTHNGTIFAGTWVGGMFESIDKGENWTRLDATNVFERIEDFTTNSQGHLFAGSSNGVRRSTDDGATWELFTEGLTRRYVRGIAGNASDVLFAATAGGGVFKSEDNGETWTEVNNGLTELTCYAVTVGPEGNVYLGTTSGVFMSEDDGESWTDISAGLSSLFTLGVFVDADSTLWAATLSGPFKKSDPASDFERSYHRNVNVVDTTSLGTLFGGGPVILRSSDDGASWTEHRWVFDGIFASASEVTRLGDLLFMGTSPRGIYVSEDDGQTWQTRNVGLDASAVTSMAADAGGVLFVGTAQGVFRSSDQGATWDHLTSLGENNIESLFVSSSGLVLAGTNNNGLHKSSDSGETWIPVDTSFSMRGVRSLAEAPNGDLFAGGADESVLKSTDNWATWDTVDSGPTFNKIKGLAVSPSGAVLVGSKDNLRRSTDGGETWEDAVAGLPEPPDIRDFEILPNGDVLAAAFRGVFRSSDEGKTWVETGSIPGAGLTSIERAGTGLYITIRGQGVAISEDDAETWTFINEGINSLDATSLLFQSAVGKSGLVASVSASTSASDMLFVGTRGGGVSKLASVATSARREIPDAAQSSRLSSNHPNPFSAQTSFTIRLDRPADVTATLLDILGRPVLAFDDRTLPAGESVVRIDGTSLPVGVYIYRIDFGDRIETKLISVAR